MTISLFDKDRNTWKGSNGERELYIVGTAHISKKSREDVDALIHELVPDTVCLELDEERYKALVSDKTRRDWENLNLFKVIRQKKTFLLVANLALGTFQKRAGSSLGEKPGTEMKRAAETAKEAGAHLEFIDRPIQLTLRRAWRKSSLTSRFKLFGALGSAVFSKAELTEQEIEELKKGDSLSTMLEEMSKSLPAVKTVLIDERDLYLAKKIREIDAPRALIVVGAGHIPGITRHLENQSSDELTFSELEQVPPPSLASRLVPWLFTLAILALIILVGIFKGASHAGALTLSWILINGLLAAGGALLALANPLTILAAFISAPITSLIPTIGVGFVTGIVETLVRKPRVSDALDLTDAASSLKGIYRNRITRVLLVFVLSSLGSAIGTFIGAGTIIGLSFAH